MLKIKVEVKAQDEHKLITKLEMIQWDIAGGATSGDDWVITKENEDEVKP